MTFPLRATQLMRELDQFQTDLTENIALIAAELAKGPDMDNDLVKRETFHISKALHGFDQFLARVDLGPEAPVEPGTRVTHPINITWQTLQYQVSQARLHFNQWNIIHSWINRHLNFGSQALYAPAPHADNVQASQGRSANKVFDLLHGFVNPNDQSDQGKESGAFADIGLPQTKFIQHVHAAYRITLAQRLGRPARFLDIGCGGGLKVLSAAQYFRPSEGLDFEPNYVRAAQNLLDRTYQKNAHVFEANGLTFENYDQYDVIYFYRPLSDMDLLHKLEEHIIRTARPDALLIAPYQFFDDRFEELGCARVAGQVYLAQGTDQDADALRRKAEYIGPHVPKSASGTEILWAPIQHALRNNGFG